ncbi:putative ABC transport system permease protein [Mucilaginibacter gossypiicola]|uniref:Putative ABC transport system permease protein n=1 Tax=Mucilaginibacter gossypiicola TaxID=551995 RepID=A0A1H8N0E7_9SPHI|nr:ABC transporter permease [Mucilaginibacter gossypiicola]SEO23077.1 putative ABC transport system permease protein [Mucilaginibacter gossypiicola]
MLRNYFKTALRSLLKNKGFTFINIIGLALGLAICLLITFYVTDELSYDQYNVKHERIYRVNTDLKFSGTLTEYAITAIPVANVLKTECPEVETAVRVTPALNIRFKKGDEIVREDGTTFYSEPNIFDVFTLPLLSGDAKTALKEPNTVVIAESMAKKYFNRSNVIGQTLFLVTSGTSLKITGVMKDMPVQSHFRANFLLATDHPINNDAPWNRLTAFATYVLLKPNANINRLESKLNAEMQEGLKGSSTMNYSKFRSGGNYFKLSLMPVTDIHLKSNRIMELGANGNSQYVYIFSAVAIFILLLACINFMNLSTARSASRAREVGVRKVLGSSRKHLIFQFLAESLIITFVAAVIAVFAAWALLPLFNHLSNKQLVINAQTATWLLPALLSIVVIVGVLAGSYPAFFLSAFQPINVLKGKISTGFKGGTFRSTLVVFQFSISIFLVIGTLVIYNQLNYIQNKNLGFNRNQVLILNNVNTLEHPELLKQEIKKLPGVINATLTSFLPTANNKVLNYVSPGGKEGQSTQFWKIDEDYISTMGMQIKNGRGFSGEFRTDSTAMVINETAAKVFGYGNDAIGKTINTGTAKDLKKYHVIGVVKDFNFSSLHDNVTPLVMVLDNDWLARLSIRINTHNLPILMTGIEKTWKTIAPNEHFEYSFMDADFDALYRTEQRMGQLFIIFTGLAIAIACLGLFGLAAYAAEQRNREIGIRKVLGASIAAIVTMLSKDFVRLVAMSFLIAAPLAWLTMNKWLQGFAYRQDIQWWVVILAGAGAVVIAFVTISLQSFRAAAANPVESLRVSD